jgi:2-methylcitrate dehydratase PrpD
MHRAVLANDLAEWASDLDPQPAELRLADAALRDTLAVAHAARDHPLLARTAAMTPAGREAVAAHVLDYDDLHLPSTTHISAVCVPAVRAAGGGAKEYLAAAGVMARLGMALGWEHYERGWHATCTAGAPAAAAGAALASGADVATAMALAVPAAGGVQRAFGTDAKALQVGFAVEAGVRAAALAAAGASADPAALDQWFALLGGDPARMPDTPDAVPGGLAIKVYPCCYALQRPIAAALGYGDDGGTIRVRTPQSAVRPLIHARPRTGLEGKFSLEYGIAAALLDGAPGLGSFTDAAVNRPQARRIMERIEVELEPGGDGLLAGAFTIGAVEQRDPPALDDLATKLELCGARRLAGARWPTAERPSR